MAPAGAVADWAVVLVAKRARIGAALAAYDSTLVILTMWMYLA